MNHKIRGVVNLEQQIRDAEMKLFGNLEADVDEDFLDSRRPACGDGCSLKEAVRPCSCSWRVAQRRRVGATVRRG